MRIDPQQIDGRADVFAASLYFSLHQPADSRDQSILPKAGSVLGQALDGVCFAKKTSYNFALTISETVVRDNGHPYAARDERRAKFPHKHYRLVALETCDYDPEKSLALQPGVKLVRGIAPQASQLDKEFRSQKARKDVYLFRSRRVRF